MKLVVFSQVYFDLHEEEKEQYEKSTKKFNLTLLKDLQSQQGVLPAGGQVPVAYMSPPAVGNELEVDAAVDSIKMEDL